MSSAHFTDTYQRYKNCTDRISAWLLETAEECGYHLSVPPSNNEPADRPSARLKGKARKHKKKIASTPIKPNAPFRIRLAQFTELAHVIANNEKAKVPLSVVKLLQQTIELRTDCSQFFVEVASAVDDALLEASNNKHSYFIETLKGVLKILQPRYVLAKSSKPDIFSDNGNVIETANNVLNTANRFSNLELGEPSDLDQTLPEPETNLPSQNSQPTREVVFDNSDAEDDKEGFFAVYCLFKDLHDVQESLQSTWAAYKSGIVNLSSVSLITHTAILLVQRSEEKVRQAFPFFTSSNNLCQSFYQHVCGLFTMDPDHRDQPADLFNYNLMNIASFVFLPTCILLDRSRTKYKPGPCGVHDPKASRNEMTIREKFIEDSIILSNVLREFSLQKRLSHLFHRENIDGLAFEEDALSGGLRGFYNEEDTPVWLCFATQVFLDIHHLLRDRVGESFRSLQAEARSAHDLLRKSLEFTAQPLDFVWPPDNDGFFQDIKLFITIHLELDYMDGLRKSLLRSQYVPGEVAPYYLLSQHPLRCGMYQLCLGIRMRTVGLYLAIPFRSIAHTAHLYNAMRVTSALENPWPKMDQFISICTPEKLFVGGLPTSLADCFRKYSLITEMSIENYAPNRRSRPGRSKLVRSKKGLQDWSPTSPIIEIMEQRFLRCGSDEYWIYSVESLVHNEQGARAKGSKEPNIGTCRLLDFLRDALAAEQSRLNYDFLGMHFQCMEILRDIKTGLNDKFEQLLGSEYNNYMRYESLLFQIIFFVLYLARRADVARSLGLVHVCDTQPVAAATLQKSIEATINQEPNLSLWSGYAPATSQ